MGAKAQLRLKSTVRLGSNHGRLAPSTEDGQSVHPEGGQSIIEFLVVLPFLIGLTLFLIKTNTAIQVSIVNQKYARAQTLFLAQNSPVYPRLKMMTDKMQAKGVNRLVIGVSDNFPDSEEGDQYQPEATIYRITAAGQPKGEATPQTDEIKKRSDIRVRTTVALCTQINAVQMSGGAFMPLSQGVGEETRFQHYCGGLDE